MGGRIRRIPGARFDDHLQDANPFAEPGAVPSKPSAALTIDPTDWQQEVDAIEHRWQRVLTPSYAVQAIKESAIQGGPKPHGQERAGAEWGEVLHTLLEAAMKRPEADLRGLAVAALESEDLPITLADDAVTTVEQVIASELWQRARNAQHCLVEIPVAMQVPAADATGGIPTVVRGVIDLVFQEATGWVIVDYKSERVDASDIPALVAYYKQQIEAYAKTWEEVVGQTVVESGLFFTHVGAYVPAGYRSR